jgi:anti-anti-sigma factor
MPFFSPLAAGLPVEDNSRNALNFSYFFPAQGMTMELQVTHEEGYVLAQTRGPIDEEAEGLFREHLHPLVGQRGTQLILDLSQSDFISSNGVGQVVLLVGHANAQSSRVIIAALTPFVGTVFNRCKLDKYFETSDSVANAIRMVQVSISRPTEKGEAE